MKHPLVTTIEAAMNNVEDAYERVPLIEAMPRHYLVHAKDNLHAAQELADRLFPELEMGS